MIPMNESRLFCSLVLVTLVVSLALVITSSLMHVGNVGMGSPDWPGAYGLITGHHASAAGASQFSSSILPTAAIDRAHRAIASFLQLLIIALFIVALKQKKLSGRSLRIPALALALSLFLAFLGVWFGSPLRYPAVVILNLIGGIGLLALFWWLTLDIYAGSGNRIKHAEKFRFWAVVGLLVLAVEIVLGAWTDAYYAALACTTFPDCHGQWWPGMAVFKGLSLLGTLDVDAHGRVVIEQDVAAAIHMSHRIWVLPTFICMAWLGIRAWSMGSVFRVAGMVALVLLVIQAGLGVIAVLGDFPILVVASHSTLSAVIVISVLTLVHQSRHE